jgi:hypothetical protein
MELYLHSAIRVYDEALYYAQEQLHRCMTCKLKSLGLINEAPHHEDMEWRYSFTVLDLVIGGSK